MPQPLIRVGLLDSGVNDAARNRVLLNADFPPFGKQAPASGERDRLGHGSSTAACITRAPHCVLLDARIFFADLRTSAAQVASGIDWLLAQEVRLINLSFGLREDRAALRRACERALARDVMLVAASPARGEPVFPAAYEGVIRATGDARCAPGQHSWLDTTQADFGAHVRAADGRIAGASIGCANLSAIIVDWLCHNRAAGNEDLLPALRATAQFQGPERRR